MSTGASFLSPLDNVSLNMDGLLTATNQNDLIAVICTVTHNITNATTYFKLNDTLLEGYTQIELNNIVRVSSFTNCYDPPAQDRCEEMTLVLRPIPSINNTRITCESRARDRGSMMNRIDSRETITVILKDPGRRVRGVGCVEGCVACTHYTGAEMCYMLTKGSTKFIRLIFPLYLCVNMLSVPYMYVIFMYR